MHKLPIDAYGSLLLSSGETMEILYPHALSFCYLSCTPSHQMEKEVRLKRLAVFFCCFFSIWVFFHEHSRFTGQQGKKEAIFLTHLYHFHPLHRHLDIRRAITAESLPLHIASSRTRTGNLCFPSASR